MFSFHRKKFGKLTAPFTEAQIGLTEKVVGVGKRKMSEVASSE